MKRCDWVPTGDELYTRYHDEEWGVPLRDDRELFEMLCLEGAQAGLSWRTILARREGYREVFERFEPRRLARLDDARLELVLKDERIVRNRLKVYSVRDNARAYLEVVREHGSFARFIWSFVSDSPIQNRFSSTSEIPAVSPVAVDLSKALKKRGFRFVGPTICYAFMQSVGMVNDHLVTCFRHAPLRR